MAAPLAGCGSEPSCGPSTATVTNVVDGDTVDLDSGERVRYLMMDTPESTNGATDCFGQNAKQFNTDLVLGKQVELTYDVECEDRYGRLLAYVSVGGVEVNSLLVERGYACVLHIPPNGADRVVEFETLEAEAKAAGRGMWGSCEVVTCE
ncbi:MAG: thermonuclease family protein [Kofleriaceae bacterium]|nr:thermonuclease family protein [Myxococcales bacterium]MCB9561163.1 thermonuclease family protein [Kofleriaceae bacterium]MCB9571359.1 thermonuclease family protein [Kofleriaceae bacterium]